MQKTMLQLQWIGKDSRPRLEPRVLVEDSNHSYHAASQVSEKDWFDNRLIFGDNLLALKALEAEFTNHIKCVFIDPPYNTGAAFEQYDDGVEHSLWLSLMVSRLELIRRLLRPDGSLWITIDDNEGHYLKVLCDEVFGRRNFIATVVWQKKYTQANDATFFSDNHDFILVYAKDRDSLELNPLPRSLKQNKAYTNPDGDPRGPWKATPLHAKSGSDSNFEYVFNNGVTWQPPVGTYPRFSIKRLKEMDENNEIWFGKSGRSIPSRKTFLTDVKQGVAPTTIWLHDEVGHNHEARSEAKEIVPNAPFATPKPERLLHRILTLASNPGDWVLDSFAGSGTTGAVAHKMGRKWIMVELGEQCLTHVIPRLKKVIDGDDLGGVTESVGWKGGGGFRYFTLAPSLLEQDEFGNWVINKKYNAELLTQAICKVEGFSYAPSDEVYWQHGHSTEQDFIYVTTQMLTRQQIEALAREVGPNRSLVVYCHAFRVRNVDDFPNLTLKKIPKTVLAKCEWGKDDYSLEIKSLPPAPEVEPDDPPPPRRRRQKVAHDQPGLFSAEGDGQ